MPNTDKKLTDSEIKDALDVCGHTKGCTNCPLGRYEEDNCQLLLFEGTLDLINRLQAENEILRKFKAYFDFYYGCDVEILGIDEDGNTTSFDEFYNCAIANTESIEHHIAHIIKTAKAEAYKEFAERLHEELRMYGIKDKFNKAVFLNVVDKAKKELVGDNDA